MAIQLHLADHAVRDDLRIFLERLQRFGLPEVRVITRDHVVAVFGCTQAPASLTETVQVVLVMRGFELAAAPSEAIDVTVLGRGLLDRLARMGLLGLGLELPDSEVAVAWAGVMPPAGGWQQVGVVDADSLTRVAVQGAAKVAEALPEDPGEALVRKVRAQVWGQEVIEGVPAAAAFAADAMGFLNPEDEVVLTKSHTWVRLVSPRGQVIVRQLWGK